ncbi:hypothetical protein ACWF95_34900 [Streptomyces vinaceus]
MDRSESVITIGQSVPGMYAEPVLWHWVLTAESLAGERWTFDGLVNVLPSATRSEVYDTVAGGISEAYGGGRLAVIAWVLEPESLGGAA